MTRCLKLVLTATLVALSLSGCAKVMDADKIERASKAFLNEKADGNEQFDTVKCPAGKDAKDGVKFDCVFTGDQGTTGRIAISVSSSDGDYNLTVAEFRPDSEAVEEAIFDDYAERATGTNAVELLEVNCPDLAFLAPDYADITCDLTGSGDSQATLPVSLSNALEATWDFTKIKDVS